MKKTTIALGLLCAGVFSYLAINNVDNDNESSQILTPVKTIKTEKTPIEQKRLFAQERLEYEMEMQRDPQTGEIPRDQKILELQETLEQFTNQNIISRSSENVYVNRGPSNLGGRTRALAVDVSDPTSNTMLAGAVSGGVFRTINGGQSWNKVSSNGEIHNVTAIAQDTREGFQNIWYYATGESRGNSATLGGFFFGQGVWRSEDGGLNWEQLPETNSVFGNFDSSFDINNAIAVSPLNGDLFVASIGRIHRYDGTDFTVELQEPGQGGFTDVVVNEAGRVYASFNGNSTMNGIHTSETGNGSWTRISQNGSPTGWNASAGISRIVMSTASSNDDLLYTLFTNGNAGIDGDLWRYDLSTDSWTDFSSTMPDEPGGDLGGNDPYTHQGAYDQVIKVKPDDENFVVIGGSNAYKIENIETDAMFTRIGGYRNNQNFALYDLGGGDTHHPDVHALVFDPTDTSVFFTGTDGGVHRTDNVNAATVAWTNLNNNYQTYQYYHTALDPVEGSDFVFGGAQDNGTTFGGTEVGQPNLTEHTTFAGGDGVAVGIARRGTDGDDIEVYFGSQNGFMNSNLRGNVRPAGTSNSIFVTYFYLDEDNTNALYYADGTIMHKTADAENITPTTWENLGNLPTNEGLRRFTATRGDYDPANSYLLVGGSRGGVFRLDDPHNSTDLSDAINITPPGASTVNGTIVTAFAIHPTNPDIAMAVYGNYNITNIFLTNNATSDTPTWEVVERNLSAHSIRSAVITEVGGQVGYYVGTARGLFSSPDPTEVDWLLEGGGRIGMAIISDLNYRPSDNRLLIGTHGNGMFDTEATVLSVDDFTGNQAENILRVFPNPTSDLLNFRTTGANSVSGYQIIDYTGRVIDEGAVDNLSQGTIDVSTYTNGVYFIKATTQNNNSVVTRFIKR